MDIWLIEVADTKPGGSPDWRVLRVPHGLATAHAAVAWTVDLSLEAYESPVCIPPHKHRTSPGEPQAAHQPADPAFALEDQHGRR
jgi:hypothetical protein